MSNRRYYRRARKHFDPEPVFASLVDQYRERDATWAWGCCPFHDDRHPSFSMNLQTGWYRCSASHCAASGRSIVSFISQLMDLDTQGALTYLETHYG